MLIHTHIHIHIGGKVAKISLLTSTRAVEILMLMDE